MSRTRKLTLTAMFSAIAYVSMLLIKIPVGSFLKYDPKDVFLAIAGFLLGPAPALIGCALVALIEMVTVGSTGFIGFFMNLLSSAAFVFPAALLYTHKRTLRNAIVGLVIGVVAMTAVMILWNYILTPLYTGMDRSAVAGMIVPLLLPFNLGKAALNAALTMMVYKPVTAALARAHMIPDRDRRSESHTLLLIVIAGAIVAASCVSLFVVMAK